MLRRECVGVVFVKALWFDVGGSATSGIRVLHPMRNSRYSVLWQSGAVFFRSETRALGSYNVATVVGRWLPGENAPEMEGWVVGKMHSLVIMGLCVIVSKFYCSESNSTVLNFFVCNNMLEKTAMINLIT